jgi:hypothetical protein
MSDSNIFDDARELALRYIQLDPEASPITVLVAGLLMIKGVISTAKDEESRQTLEHMARSQFAPELDTVPEDVLLV